MFDLDDTLLVDMRAVEAVFEAAASRAEPDAARAKELAVTVREEARRIWRAAPTYPLAMELGIASWEGLCSDFTGGHAVIEPFREWASTYQLESWKSALAVHGIADDALAAELAVAFLAIRREHFELFAGARGLLEELRADGFLLGLLTNGPPDLQRAKLRTTGIEDAFDAVVISGEAGVGKPNPEVFRIVLDQLDVDAAAGVMVGDNPRRDIAGGQAVGMRAIRVDPNGFGRPEGMSADAEIDEIGQVRDVVRSWRAESA